MIDKTIQHGEYALQPMEGGCVRFITPDISVNVDHLYAHEDGDGIDGFTVWYEGQPFGFIDADIPDEIYKTLLQLCNEM